MRTSSPSPPRLIPIIASTSSTSTECGTLIKWKLEVDVFCLSVLWLNKFTQWKLKGSIQIRCVRQKRSIKLNIKLPVSIHEARDGQRFSLLKFLTRKHNVSQAKDKERLIRLTFQGCFLVSFIIFLAYNLNHDYIFFFSYFYTLFILPFLFQFLFNFFPYFSYISE